MAATTMTSNADKAASSAASRAAQQTAPKATATQASAAATRRTAFRWAIQLLSLVACVVLWHLAATHRMNLGVVTFQNVPPPSEVVDAAVDLLASPKLTQHLSSSLLRIAFGFVLAALVGIGLGLAIGRSNWAQLTLLPPLEVARPIPAVAWIPLSILMFPSSEGSMVFITFVGAVFPILLNTIHGVHGVDPRLIASARSLGTKRWALFAQVILPSSAPSIVTGLSIGMGTCWFCLVTAEMISGQYGIGYYTWESYTVQNYANIVVGMLVIGALGMGSSAFIQWGGGRLMPWYQAAGGKA